MNNLKLPHVLLAMLIAMILTAAVTSKVIRIYYLSNGCMFQAKKSVCYHRPTDMLYVIDPKGDPTLMTPRQ